MDGHGLLGKDAPFLVLGKGARKGDDGSIGLHLDHDTAAPLGFGCETGVVAAQAEEEQMGDGGFAAAVLATDDVDAVVVTLVVGHMVVCGEHVEPVDKEANSRHIWILKGWYGI